jgi:hypothetical protein
VNIVQAKNDENCLTPGAAPATLRYNNRNGKNLDGRTRQAIITALANGEPIFRIARRLHVGHNTITAIQQIEWAEVSKRKELVLARAARLAAAGFDKLNEEMDAGNIKGALLVPVTGMATDKVIALSGDATNVTNLNLNIQPVDIAAQFEKLHAAIREKAAKVEQARKEEEASTTRQQLALPGGETIADSSAETGFKAENRNG